MPKIENLDQVLTDFQGTPLTEGKPSEALCPACRQPIVVSRPITLEVALGNILTRRSTDDPQRSWVLARLLFEANGSMSLLDHDMKYVIDAVKADRTYFDSIRGPVLAALEPPLAAEPAPTPEEGKAD